MIERRYPAGRRKPSDRRDADRRFDGRVSSDVRIRFLRAGKRSNEILRGLLADVSVSGIRILFEEPLRPGETLLVEVRDDEDRCFNLTAQVVWTEETDDGRHIVGCELCAALTDRQCKLLQKFTRSAASN